MSELEQLPAGREDGAGAGHGTGSGAEQFYVRCGWEKVGKFRAMR
jgi:hypothetical protein